MILPFDEEGEGFLNADEAATHFQFLTGYQAVKVWGPPFAESIPGVALDWLILAEGGVLYGLTRAGKAVIVK